MLALPPFQVLTDPSMLETAIGLAQIAILAGPAAWLATGVWDNLRYPANNETYTAQVLSMERMRNDYPDEFATVGHRAITNRKVQRLAFRVVVAGECIAALLLILAMIGLFLSLFGVMLEETARALAILGAAAFTSIWAAFLVVGNYFCYWFCHEGAQNTHYQMTLWGIGTLLFLALT